MSKHKLNIYYRGSPWGSRPQQHAYCLRYAHSQHIESHLGQKQPQAKLPIAFLFSQLHFNNVTSHALIYGGHLVTRSKRSGNPLKLTQSIRIRHPTKPCVLSCECCEDQKSVLDVCSVFVEVLFSNTKPLSTCRNIYSPCYLYRHCYCLSWLCGYRWRWEDSTMSRHWKKLNLLHTGPIHCVNIFEVETTNQYIRDKYKELFNGVGLFKGYKLKLNVNISGKPVAQPVRRNPFGVREKVEKKLDELLACGIIEEVPVGPLHLLL